MVGKRVSLVLNTVFQVLYFLFFYKFIFIHLCIYLCIYFYFWLRWVFVAAHGPSLVVASGGHSLLQCAGFPLRWLLLLQSTGSRRGASVVVARRLQSAGSAAAVHGLSCSAACEILPDRGSNPCPLHWQADSQPLRHQGSPQVV